MPAAKRLSRRTVLKGLGTAVSLPILEAMLPGTARAAVADTAQSPLRMAYLYVPNGIHMADWTPKNEGPLTELSKSLKTLEKHKGSMNVLSGLTLNGGRALGDGGGDHARSVASYLTGAHPRKTAGKDIFNGPSVDQVGAQQIGHLTRFPSLELGCEPSSQGGNCDTGYSCLYTSNMSWRTPTSPMAKEINPQSVFDRLFGGGSIKENAAAIAKRNTRRKSVLDFVNEDAKDLHKKLGHNDQVKLDEYLFAVRDIEKRMVAAERLQGKEVGVPDYPRPAGVPKDFDQHVRMMMDMLVLALQTDSTRLITFMYTNDSSGRSYPQIGVKEGHHDLSHHGRDAKKQESIAKINVLHLTHFNYMLDRMTAIKELNGNSLLDNSLVMYGSGLSDGDRHNHDDLPIILLGKGGGQVKTGRHIRFAKETPLCNLYLKMLQMNGSTAKKFGDSTGVLNLA